MDIRVTLPGGRAIGRDRYAKVAITPDASPLRFEFSYMEGFDEGGPPRYVCMEVAVQQLTDDPAELGEDLPDVTTAVLRDLASRFDAFEAAARASLAALPRLSGTLAGTGTATGNLTAPVFRRTASDTLGTTDTATTRGSVAPRRRRELTADFLRDIADRYRAHLKRGASPALALSREERVSVRTVRNWLQHARAKGLLGPGERGRAGEHPPTGEEQQ